MTVTAVLSAKEIAAIGAIVIVGMVALVGIGRATQSNPTGDLKQNEQDHRY